MPKAEDSEETQLLQNKGYGHENAFEAILRQKHHNVNDISKEADSIFVDKDRPGYCEEYDKIIKHATRETVS